MQFFLRSALESAQHVSNRPSQRPFRLLERLPNIKIETDRNAILLRCQCSNGISDCKCSARSNGSPFFARSSQSQNRSDAAIDSHSGYCFTIPDDESSDLSLKCLPKDAQPEALDKRRRLVQSIIFLCVKSTVNARFLCAEPLNFSSFATKIVHRQSLNRRRNASLTE